MTEEQWLNGPNPKAMLGFLQGGRARGRKLRLFAAAVSRRAWSMLTDERMRRAVETAEAFADGLADEQELRAVLGAEADNHDWQGDISDVAHAVALRPSDFDVRAASTVTSHVAHALGQSAFPEADFDHDSYLGAAEIRSCEFADHASLLRDIFGNPFRPPAVDPTWLSWNGGILKQLAWAAYEERELPGGTLDVARLAVLADALTDAGCTDTDLLEHLRGPGPHVRSCWPVDLLTRRQ
jgi:hypothetical protein